MTTATVEKLAPGIDGRHAPQPKGRSVLVELDRTGDSRLTWDPQNADEVAAARAHFDKLKAKGHTAYAVGPDGDRGRIISAFDPTLEKVVMVPRIVGG